MCRGNQLLITCLLVALATNQVIAQSKITVLVDPDQKPNGPLSKQIQERFGNLAVEPVARAGADQKSERWEILYATNRAVSKQSLAGLEYGSEDGALTFGQSFILLPRSKGNSSHSAQRKATTAVQKSWFYDRLNAQTQSAVDHDVLIFVHGFNVDFDSAIIRAAQIARDIPFNGAVVCYVWPTKGGIRNYGRDETIVKHAEKPLADFLLQTVDSVKPGTRISILVHSMGNRAVLGALNRLPQSLKQRKPFRYIIFAAPDVAVDTFRAQVSNVAQMAHRVTLYACAADTALKASRQLHRDPNRPWVRIDRAGDSTNPVVVDGVDTIDVSDVDTSFMGHSYYGSNKTVLTDLLYLLKCDRDPRESSWLQPKSIRSGTYWKMNKKQIAILSARQNDSETKR